MAKYTSGQYTKVHFRSVPTSWALDAERLRTVRQQPHRCSRVTSALHSMSPWPPLAQSLCQCPRHDQHSQVGICCAAPVRDHVESYSHTRLNIDSILSPYAILISVLARSARSVVAVLMSPTPASEKTWREVMCRKMSRERWTCALKEAEAIRVGIVLRAAASPWTSCASRSQTIFPVS